MTPQTLRDLVARGKTEQVITQLLRLTEDTDLHGEAIHLSSRYQAWQRQDRKGLLDHAQSNQTQAQLTQAALALIDQWARAQPATPISNPADDGPSPPGKPPADDPPGGSDSPPPDWRFPAFAGLGLLLLVGGAAFFVKCPSPSQAGILRALLSAGLAGFAATLPGYFRLPKQHLVAAGGALGVFAFSYLLNPATLVKDDNCRVEPFTLTLFLENAQGETVLREQGLLILAVPGDKRQERIDGDGKVVFTTLPAKLAEESTRVELQAPGWQFPNGSRSQRIALSKSNQSLVIERDGSLRLLRGSVRDANGFVPGVRVSVGDDFALTDSVGRFRLELSEENRREELSLTVSKDGYQIQRIMAYPASSQETEIVLSP